MSGEFIEHLKRYYDRLFPYQLIVNWLSYKDGGPNCFKFREFSFTLSGGNSRYSSQESSDILFRYQAFDNPMEFRGALLHRVPKKIDVGAVYNISPREGKANPNFRPQQRELVFDIDISDYDDVRNCCKESNICQKCWPFMKIGAKILYKILTKEFGFKNLLFVYSGRRGFHCWVCDKEARELGSDARRAIADYFSVVTGGHNVVKRVSLPQNLGLHPMISKALEVIDQDFEDLMIDKQDFLSNEHLVQNVIDLAEAPSLLNDQLNDKCKTRRLTSKECWEVMKSVSAGVKGKCGKTYIQEVKLQHCFPRLDANVTKGFNHLLKLPFCIHPGTGNVCVPIDIDDIDSFDITKVPNLKTLTAESMDPYIRIMKKFLDNL